jgi:dienelactone hydrolase
VLSLCLIFLLTHSAQAGTTGTATYLNEKVIMVPIGGTALNRFELETTIFKPVGEGPFPLIVINHGKTGGGYPTNKEKRARFLVAAREFVRRGYVVAIPMRQGFSKSGGAYTQPGCNVALDGQLQANDVQAAIEFLKHEPFIDKDRIIIAGQSHGGLTTLALGARNIPGVRGLINFSGGSRNPVCDDWRRALVNAVASYAKNTDIPSLWFYADNDSYFPPYIADWMYQEYVKAGGKAGIVRVGEFGKEGHFLFSLSQGLIIWMPEVEKFLESLSLPYRPVIQVIDSPS